MNYFEWYWAFVIVISMLYAALILWFTKGYKSINTYKPEGLKHQVFTSVIIPFYNEEKYLKDCVQNIIQQSKGVQNFELLLIDDFSTDKSFDIAADLAKNNARVCVIKNTKKGKKNALLAAIEKAKGEFIISTDADCIHSKNWLTTLIEYNEAYQPDLLLAPVIIAPANTALEHFQKLEFASLVASGAGAAGINHPIMCNGANLGFSKKKFKELNDPYRLKYESGDDVFLLHALKKSGSKRIDFVKSESAIVYTHPISTIKGFYYQRQRWASKANGYKDKDTLFTATIVFGFSVLILFGIFGLLFNSQLWKPLCLGLALKTIIDMYFYQQIDDVFKTKRYLPYLLAFELFYAVYIVVSAIAGSVQNNWKRSN